jgi:hypothetical protein
MLELTEQGIGYLANTLIWVLIAQTLDTGNETWPGAIFQFVQHRRWMLLISHGLYSFQLCVDRRLLRTLRSAVLAVKIALHFDEAKASLPETRIPPCVYAPHSGGLEV